MSMDHPISILSLIVGIVVTILGVLPFLSGVFPVPSILILGGSTLLWVVAVLGVISVFLPFLCHDSHMLWIRVLIALIIATPAVIEILSSMKVLAFAIVLGDPILRVMLIVEGISSIADAFGGRL